MSVEMVMLSFLRVTISPLNSFGKMWQKQFNECSLCIQIYWVYLRCSKQCSSLMLLTRMRLRKWSSLLKTWSASLGSEDKASQAKPYLHFRYLRSLSSNRSSSAEIGKPASKCKTTSTILLKCVLLTITEKRWWAQPLVLKCTLSQQISPRWSKWSSPRSECLKLLCTI